MVESYEKYEKLSGKVLVGGEDYGDCRYEFKYNPYNTNGMSITLFDPPDDLSFGSGAPQVDIVTKFYWGTYCMKLNTELAAGSMFWTKEGRYTAPVTEFQAIEYVDDTEVAHRIHYGYEFPLTSVTDTLFYTTSHPEFGYVRGRYDETDEVFRPRKDSFVIPSPHGEITVGDYFEFEKGGSNLYPQTHLIRRSVAGIKTFVGPETDYDSRRDEIRGVINDMFQMLSLVERTRMDWHTEHISTYSASNKLISIQTTYRWVAAPHPKYRLSKNSLQKRRQTLIQVLDQFWKSTPDKQTVLFDIVDNFKIANTARFLETQLILWHSCLDFFKEIYLNDLSKSERRKIRNKMSFSKQLVYLIEKAGITVEDLECHERVEAIKSAIKKEVRARNLIFTKMRNDYLHDGFHALKGREREASEQTRIMRAIAERLYLKLLEMDFVETSLGGASLV